MRAPLSLFVWFVVDLDPPRGVTAARLGTTNHTNHTNRRASLKSYPHPLIPAKAGTQVKPTSLSGEGGLVIISDGRR